MPHPPRSSGLASRGPLRKGPPPEHKFTAGSRSAARLKEDKTGGAGHGPRTR